MLQLNFKKQPGFTGLKDYQDRKTENYGTVENTAAQWSSPTHLAIRAEFYKVLITHNAQLATHNEY
jgi:hypothetical protein